MLEIGALALLAAGGAYAYSLVQRGRAHARWKRVLEAVATQIGGRASPASMFDAPELRVTGGGPPVTLRIKNFENPGRAVGMAELPIGSAKGRDGKEGLRLYVGWDIWVAPRGIDHIPEIPFPRAFGLEGKLVVRANDAAIASRFVERAVTDLTDIRREANARAIEVMCRVGGLQLAVHGLEESALLLERMVIIARRLAALLLPEPLSRPSSASAPSEPEKPASASTPTPIEILACSLCGDKRRSGEAWVRCSRCKAPYHQRCWFQATGCTEPGCQETRSIPEPGS